MGNLHSCVNIFLATVNYEKKFIPQRNCIANYVLGFGKDAGMERREPCCKKVKERIRNTLEFIPAERSQKVTSFTYSFFPVGWENNIDVTVKRYEGREDRKKIYEPRAVK